ncbi:MAG TPA: hypothetical protein VEQ63_07895, partial [Bryobacteraceae bacterium]|nr:hypothetical protein [Bryobacteraceae bacterium]
MTPHRLSRIRELFEGALGCPPDERWSFLKNPAHDDTQLIEEVKRLLVANDKEAALIDQPLLQPRILGGRIGDLPDTETFRVGTSQSQQPPDRPAN